MTNTRVHTHVDFADPHLVCAQCQQPVTGFHDPDRCGCKDDWHLLPCRHMAEAHSTCPSWSPVDGCRCQEHLGHVPHGPTPASTAVSDRH